MKEAPVCIKFLRFCERDTRIMRTEIWKCHSSERTFIPHGALFPPCNVFLILCVQFRKLCYPTYSCGNVRGLFATFA